jgi:hypothetical protein
MLNRMSKKHCGSKVKSNKISTTQPTIQAPHTSTKPVSMTSGLVTTPTAGSTSTLTDLGTTPSPSSSFRLASLLEESTDAVEEAAQQSTSGHASLTELGTTPSSPLSFLLVSVSDGHRIPDEDQSEPAVVAVPSSTTQDATQDSTTPVSNHLRSNRWAPPHEDKVSAWQQHTETGRRRR